MTEQELQMIEVYRTLSSREQELFGQWVHALADGDHDKAEHLEAQLYAASGNTPALHRDKSGTSPGLTESSLRTTP